MLQWLKKHFIPHEDNNHYPHLLRDRALVFFLALIIVAEGMFLFSAIPIIPSSLFSLIAPGVLVQDANESRQTEGLGTLTTNPLLEQAAAMKANDMAAKGYFAHTSPEGVTPWYWLKQAGYKYSMAGENLAVYFIDSRDVHTAWMNSPGHRANIINGSYTEIGIATATGIYQGGETTFVVQYFGLPAQAGKPPATKIVLAPVQVSAAETILPLPSAFPVAQVDTAPMLTKIISEPRRTTNYALIIITVLILTALAATVIMRFEFPHHGLTLKPMLFVIFLLGLIVFNRQLALFASQIL